MNQLDIFGQLYQPYKFTKKVRLIELFAGVGSQAMALRDLGVPFEHHRVIEFDKYAIKSYNAIHGTDFPTSDIRDIHASDLDMTCRDYQYIMTYSFPCQDLSKAGKQKGMSKGSGTRSGLLWEVERIIGECWRYGRLPDVLLMENVPEVIGTKNIKDFLQWQAVLEACGYQNYVKIINAKDQGIPQKRKRCFMVSILGDYSYSFPESVPLKLRLRDMLELEVDEKYYLKSEVVERFISNGNTNPSGRGMNGKVNLKDVADTITTNKGEGPKIMLPNDIAKTVRTSERGSFDKHSWDIIQVGNCMPSATRDNPSQGRVYDQDGISPTLGCMQGGNRQPMVLIGGALIIPEATKRGYAEAHEGDSINLEQPNSKTRRGRAGKGVAQTLTTSCNQAVVEPANIINPLKGKSEYGWHFEQQVYDKNGITRALKAGGGSGNIPKVVELTARVRKLTPLECWRLMGFSDDDFYKAAKVNSNSQLYKQAGNSIVKQVLMAIFKQMI
ncbi:DNA (cytosine-5-)-methyltransferase [Dielma fastidiosa]|uniref:DNA (cytosine-5-)-methyltransferase n=1 Tax=Dielma fastidiosa TaxID=1034346 RepID=UPI000E4C7420|nr:DNA (cytosine-5-)-methyltransferase [Dielma fastidiosa]RHN01499.1 DNA (cytosine-5-)-methyltransferase [Dielma fastidiosa]